MIEKVTEINTFDKKDSFFIDLNVFHPASYIVFVCKRNDRNKYNDYSNFTNWNNVDENLFYYNSPMNASSGITKTNYTSYVKQILKEGKLIFNGVDRFSEKTEGFFRLSQKNENNINSSDDTDYIDGIYIYSFSLNPKKYEPSGSCNMSAINKVKLNLELITPPLQTDGVSGAEFSGPSPYQYKYDVNVYIVNYNIFKVNSGMGGLVFAN